MIPPGPGLSQPAAYCCVAVAVEAAVVFGVAIEDEILAEHRRRRPGRGEPDRMSVVVARDRCAEIGQHGGGDVGLARMGLRQDGRRERSGDDERNRPLRRQPARMACAQAAVIGREHHQPILVGKVGPVLHRRHDLADLGVGVGDLGQIASGARIESARVSGRVDIGKERHHCVRRGVLHQLDHAIGHQLIAVRAVLVVFDDVGARWKAIAGDVPREDAMRVERRVERLKRREPVGRAGHHIFKFVRVGAVAVDVQAGHVRAPARAAESEMLRLRVRREDARRTTGAEERAVE